MALVKRIFPFLRWFEGYNATALRADLISGVTVALVLIPQSMAYAQLAGLPAYYGLYAAFLPPMVAALFGSSNQLATGPVAVVSLMTAATLEPLATAGGPQYIAYAIMLALLVGLFQLALGLLRMGLVVNFLSHPVVNGFTNAAALIIATSQLSKIFGVYVDKAAHHYETIVRVVVAAVHGTHWPTVGMAALAFAVMIGLKRIQPKIPNVLVAVVVTTAIAWAVGLERTATVGIDSIHHERTQLLIRGFNAAVVEKEELERLRAAGGERQSVPSPQQQESQVCTACHGARALTALGDRSKQPAAHSGGALALHHVAGLLDLRIQQIKGHLTRYRSELRGMRFVAVARGQQMDFYPPDEVPQGREPHGDRWQVRVGNKQLTEKAIILAGGGAVVSTIPAGLPQLKLPDWDWNVAGKLFIMAMIISLLGFMEAISIAKAMAARTQQRLDPNQELVGQGLANIIGCMGQSYAVSGSFSRSAVNLQAGALTGLSNVFSSGVVVIVLLFFTPLLYHLPQSVLAAIIMMAVIGLLDVRSFIHAYRAQPFDGITGIITFFGTLFFAPHLEWGIAIGVALSIGAYLYRTMKPPVPELSLHTDGSLRDAERHKLSRCRHVAAIRFDGPLNFANASYLEDKVLEVVSEMPELRSIHIAAHGINEVDASGEEMLRHVVERTRDAGYRVSLSGLKSNVRDVLMRTRLYQVIGEENIFPTQVIAMASIHDRAHEGSSETNCPLLPMVPRVTELSLHTDGSLRDAQRHHLRICQHISALRLDGSLDLASARYLDDKVDAELLNMPELKHVFIAAHRINQIDEWGVHTLERIVTRLREAYIDISFSGFTDDVADVLKQHGVWEKIGEEHIYPTQVQAIRGIYATAHEESDEEVCPLRPLVPQVVELSLHADGSLRDAQRHQLRVCQHVAALRFDGDLDEAGAAFLEAKVEEQRDNLPELRHIFVAAHRIHQADDGGARALARIVDRVRGARLGISFSGFSDEVADVLQHEGVWEQLGEEAIHPTQVQAIRAIYLEAHGHTPEAACPLSPLMPYIAELSLHSDGSLRDAKRRGLKTCRHISALRFDGALDRSSARYLEVKVDEQFVNVPELRHVMIAGHRITAVDEYGAETLARVAKKVRGAGRGISFSGFAEEVLDQLAAHGLLDALGQIYPTQIQAIESIHGAAHERSNEGACPLKTVVVEQPSDAEKAGETKGVA